MDKLHNFLETIDEIRSYLNEDVEESQILGTEAHELIQDWIEDCVKEGNLDRPIDQKNKYARAFVEQVRSKKKLQSLVLDVEELLPCEIPVGYFDKNREQHTFTGM